MASYERLRPRSAMEGVSGLRGGEPASVVRTSERLQLGSGTQVYYPEDLLPVVPRESTTAVAADRASAARSRAAWLTVGGIALVVAGAAVVAAPFVTSDSNESVSTEPIYFGTGLVVLSLPVFLFGGAERRRAEQERATAFEGYEPALRQRLDLCPSGARVVPCP